MKSISQPLIQDIAPRQAQAIESFESKMNVPIGELDRQWHNRQSTQLVKSSPKKSYTYVPPLGDSGHKAKKYISRAAAVTGLVLTSLIAKFRAIDLFPKKFTADKGLSISLDTLTLDLIKKVALPIGVILAVFLGAVMLWQPMNKYTLNAPHNVKAVTAASTSTSADQSSTSKAASTPQQKANNLMSAITSSSKKATNSMANNSNSSAATSATTSDQTAGATGSGSDSSSSSTTTDPNTATDPSDPGTGSSSTTTDPTTGDDGDGSDSGDSGDTPSLPVAVPPVDVSLGDQTVVSTDPTTLTLN